MQICNYIRLILEKERHPWSIVRSFQRNNLLVFNDIDKTANLFCFCGFVLVKFSIPGISTKSSGSEASLKTLTQAELDKSYRATAMDTGLYRQISWNTTRNGRCGIYIRQPNKPPTTIAIPGGDLCSNYRAEAPALLTATETVTQLERRPKKVVLLTDSLSVLQSLASGKPVDYAYGNEVADQLAKEESKKQQPKSKLSYQEA